MPDAARREYRRTTTCRTRVVVADADGSVVAVNAAAVAPARQAATELVGHELADGAAAGRPAGPRLVGVHEAVRRAAEPGPPAGTPARASSGPAETTATLLVTASYVRDDARRLTSGGGVPARHGRAQPPRAKRRRAGLGRRPRAALAADERQGLHRDAAGEVGPVQRRAEAAHAAHGQRRRRPADPADQRAARRVADRDRPARAAQAGGRPARTRAARCRGSGRGGRAGGPVRRPDRGMPLPEVWADPDKLAQVVGNIVENALRHGGGTVTITVGPVGRRGVSVEVVDEGEGIAGEALPRIFTKFWHDAPPRRHRARAVHRQGHRRRARRDDRGRRAPGRRRGASRFTLPAGTPSFAR